MKIPPCKPHFVRLMQLPPSNIQFCHYFTTWSTNFMSSTCANVVMFASCTSLYSGTYVDICSHICLTSDPKTIKLKLITRYHSIYCYNFRLDPKTRDGTSQDFSDSSHSSRVSALTRDSRVRSKKGIGD